MKCPLVRVSRSIPKALANCREIHDQLRKCNLRTNLVLNTGTALLLFHTLLKTGMSSFSLDSPIAVGMRMQIYLTTGLQPPTRCNQNLKHQAGEMLEISYKIHFWPFFPSTCQRMKPGRMTLIRFKPSPFLQVDLTGSHLDCSSYSLLIQLVLLGQYLKCYNKTPTAIAGLKDYGRKEVKALESHCISFTTLWYSSNPGRLECNLTEYSETIPEQSRI